MREGTSHGDPARGALGAISGIWRGAAYRQYLRRRGFTASQGWPFVRRAFLECWTQPGFHRFWRTWNPQLGFLTFRLYGHLGGNASGAGARIVVFVASGLTHALIALPFLGWSYTIPVTFTCFGVLVAGSHGLGRRLHQERWPPALNLLVNVGLVLLSFEAGFHADALLSCGACHR